MRQIGYVIVGSPGGLFLAAVVFLVARGAGRPAHHHRCASHSRSGPGSRHRGGPQAGSVCLRRRQPRPGDAITAAGGLTSDADLSALNLAENWEDGQQLSIPGSGEGGPAGTEPTAAFRIVPSVEATSTASGDLININTASAEARTYPASEPTTADRIVQYRTDHGPFASTSDILNVPGIGPATFDSIKSLITV